MNSENTKPLVSVCIPVYNGEKFIKETLDSVINQTYKNIEILIIDNCSTDNTVEIIKSFDDQRIRLLVNYENIGVVRNFNLCITLARSEYIAIFHADDVYQSTIIEEELAAFLEFPEIGAVFTSANKIDETGKNIGSIDLISELRHKPVLNFDDVIRAFIVNGPCFMVCPSCIAKKSVYMDIGLYNPNISQYIVDTDLYMRLLEKYPIRIIDKRLLNYRLNTSQGSYEYKFTRLEEPGFFKILDKYIYDPKYNLTDMTDHYNILKQEEYANLALNHLVHKNTDMAKHLIKKSLSFKRIIYSIKNYKKFRRLLYSLVLLLYIYFGIRIVSVKSFFKIIKSLKGYR